MSSAKAKSTAPAGRGGQARRKDAPKGRMVDTVVREGDLITFGPTGEQVRVARIEGGTITFEKRP